MPPPSSRSAGSKGAFVDNGFKTWKRAVQRFREHETHEFQPFLFLEVSGFLFLQQEKVLVHRAASLGLASRVGTPVTTVMSKGKVAAMQQARSALKAIFSSLRFLAAQGIPHDVPPLDFCPPPSFERSVGANSPSQFGSVQF